MHCQTVPGENMVAPLLYVTARVVRARPRSQPQYRGDLSKSEVWRDLKNRLAGIGVADREIDSLALIPLLETALDDGVIKQDTCDKILGVMRSLRLLTSGIDPKLRDLWSIFEGHTEFLMVWTVYLRDLNRQMRPEENAVFKSLVVGACAFMIRTIGGFLRVRGLESRVMCAIESAFAFRPAPIR